jgi:type III restriction enzyme
MNTAPASSGRDAENLADEHKYVPDFIACIHLPSLIGRVARGEGADDLLSVIVEATCENKKDKAAKVATARALWVPAVNNHGGFGRWTFIEIADPWDAENLIRTGLQKGTGA